MWSDCLWILARTSSLATRSLYEMRSILRQHLISMARILFCSSPLRAHDSQAYREKDVKSAHAPGRQLD